MWRIIEIHYFAAVKRKKFLSSAAVLAGSLISLPGKAIPAISANDDVIMPPYLMRDDKVGITAPSGYVMIEDVQEAKSRLEYWGYNVFLGATIGLRANSFAGTDDERLADLQAMLDDASIKAILIARGGYGLGRIIDRLNFKKFRTNPKWIIGFSDATLLLNHIFANHRIAGIHSKMATSFVAYENATPEQILSIESINDLLSRGGSAFGHPSKSIENSVGEAEGFLVGGNLSMIESALATKSALNFKNCILFLEDTGEYPYRIDRMINHLKRAGVLASIRGLALGNFKMKEDDPGQAFGLSPERIIREATAEFDYPIGFNFPIGHQKSNMALYHGVVHKLKVTEESVALIQKSL